MEELKRGHLGYQDPCEAHGRTERQEAAVRILIVEDDAVFRRGLVRLFLHHNFEVFQTANGEEAIHSIQERLPDLVICDYRLPRLNGLEVLRHLRHARHEVPFILVTGHLSEAVESEAKQLGAHSILEKPVALDLLRQKCREALRDAGGHLG